jgi:hypothetical protein
MKATTSAGVGEPRYRLVGLRAGGGDHGAFKPDDQQVDPDRHCHAFPRLASVTMLTPWARWESDR